MHVPPPVISVTRQHSSPFEDLPYKQLASPPLHPLPTSTHLTPHQGTNPLLSALTQNVKRRRVTSSSDAVKSICDVLGALSPISSSVAVLMSAGVRARNDDGFQASHAPTDRLTRQARCAHFKLRWLQQNNNNRDPYMLNLKLEPEDSVWQAFKIHT